MRMSASALGISYSRPSARGSGRAACRWRRRGSARPAGRGLPVPGESRAAGASGAAGAGSGWLPAAGACDCSRSRGPGPMSEVGGSRRGREGPRGRGGLPGENPGCPARCRTPRSRRPPGRETCLRSGDPGESPLPGAALARRWLRLARKSRPATRVDSRPRRTRLRPFAGRARGFPPGLARSWRGPSGRAPSPAPRPGGMRRSGQGEVSWDDDSSNLATRTTCRGVPRVSIVSTVRRSTIASVSDDNRVQDLETRRRGGARGPTATARSPAIRHGRRW